MQRLCPTHRSHHQHQKVERVFNPTLWLISQAVSLSFCMCVKASPFLIQLYLLSVYLTKLVQCTLRQ